MPPHDECTPGMYALMFRVARTIYIRCIHGIIGRENTKYTVIYGVYQRGVSEAQNEYVFCMLLGQVAVACPFQAQLCYVDFSAAELETCKLWPPASAATA